MPISRRTTFAIWVVRIPLPFREKMWFSKTGLLVQRNTRHYATRVTVSWIELCRGGTLCCPAHIMRRGLFILGVITA